MKKFVVSLISVLFFVTAVAAQEFDPLQGKTIQLGVRFGFGYAKNEQMNSLIHAIGDFETADMNAFMDTKYQNFQANLKTARKKPTGIWALMLSRDFFSAILE